MHGEQLSEQDHGLIERARATIERLYKPEWNQVAAAVRMASGRIYTAINLDTHVGVAGICAEPIAIGQAILNAEQEGDLEIQSVVAVRGYGATARAPDEIRIVSPCGKCRELIVDYGPEARVILPGNGWEQDEDLVKVPVVELLPSKYARE